MKKFDGTPVSRRMRSRILSQSRHTAGMESNRIGRLIGVCLYLTITVASSFAFSYSPRLQNARSILMIISLLLLFIVRLVNIPALLRTLDFADNASLLNFIVYVLPQIGTIVLTVMCLKLRKIDVTLAETAPLIPVAIAIYAICFAAECVMMIRYRMNVDGSLKLALLSRLAYFVGFSGTAFIFFFSDPMKPFEPDPNFDTGKIQPNRFEDDAKMKEILLLDDEGGGNP